MTDREILAAIWATRRRSWDDDTDDASRLVLERAYDAMRVMRHAIKERDARLARQAVLVERAELDLESLRRVAYGPQKGGAA